MKAPRIVGLAGCAGVGKSAIGRAMWDNWGYEPCAFASLLRDLGPSFGVNTEPLTVAKRVLRTGATLSPLQVAQCNKIRGEMWALANGIRSIFSGRPSPIVARAMTVADMEVDARANRPVPREIVSDGKTWRPKVVYDDVRRKDEAAAIRERGGIVVWIEGPSLWGDKVPTGDTDLKPEDCDFVLDMSDVAVECGRLRRDSRAGDADGHFVRSALKRLDSQYGFTKALEGDGPKPRLKVMRDAEETDLE